MSEHLNEQFFRRLAGKLPAFKRDYADKRMAAKASSNGGNLKQPPCCVCGKYFGSKTKEFSLTPGRNKPFCPACQKLLDDGCCVFTTTDLRGYAAIKIPMPKPGQDVPLDVSKLVGKICLVSWEDLQVLTARKDGRQILAILTRLISEIPDPAKN